MDASHKRALEILDTFARAPRQVGPVTLSEEYLAAVARVERFPENQSGRDKTARDAAQATFFRHYHQIRRP
jgi:hypothetical protein